MANVTKSSVSARQARYGATASLYTIVVIAALIMVNWLGNRYNKSFDTTSNKKFTLSQETTKIIRGLKSDATIAYLDKASGFEGAKATLDRYANLSSKVHVKYVNVLQNPMEASAYGTRSLGTAFVTVGSRREEARTITEESITGAFVKDLKGVRKVCFVQGSGEHQLEETKGTGLSQLKTALERDNYVAQPITLIDKTQVPADCTASVVAGPKNDYTPNEVSALKTYVENGGRAMILLDPPLDFQSEHISENAAMTGLLSDWGVTLNNDLVLEENPVGQMVGVGPEVPLVSTYEPQAIVSDLKGHYTGFPVTRSMQIKNGSKTTVEKLFSTTDSSIATSKLNSNEINPADPSNKKGPFLLGAAGSYNTGKPNEPGRFVVIGTSGFLDNAMLHFQGNPDLALNAVNWLTSDEDLISIRPKETQDRRLNVTQSKMNIFGYTDLVAVPLIIIVAGVMIFVKRR